MIKTKQYQLYRFISQIIFALICIWIGIEFHYFIKSLENGTLQPVYYRPPGVEGFLPISSLMSIYYFLLSGHIHPFHPAGFFILLAIITVSFVLGKSFCSWMCPVGFISETVGDLGNKIYISIIKKIPRIPRFIDYFLRSIKYFILAFFVYAIFFSMDVTALRVFLDGDYNLMSDIKMYYFFSEISKFALTVIGVLLILSVIIRNFWCRYLCPYGALLGIIGLLSPFKIKRNLSTCIDCKLCTKACPSRINVHKVKKVISDECVSCMRCVDTCPVKNTLHIANPVFKSHITNRQLFLVILSVYFLIIGIAVASGNWHNKISSSVYKDKFQNVKTLGHPTSARELENLK